MRMTGWLVASMCALLSAPVLAGNSGVVPVAERYARRCQRQAPSRIIAQQGTMLWGTWSGWTEKDRTKASEQKSVLVSANLEGLAVPLEGAKSLRLEGGRLAVGPGARGAVLQGMSSDGQPVEVAICDEQPAQDDPEAVWYSI